LVVIISVVIFVKIDPLLVFVFEWHEFMEDRIHSIIKVMYRIIW